jgi:hypothetical protein
MRAILQHFVWRPTVGPRKEAAFPEPISVGQALLPVLPSILYMLECLRALDFPEILLRCVHVEAGGLPTNIRWSSADRLKMRISLEMKPDI